MEPVRHPEWKRLYDVLAGILRVDMVYTYPELSEGLGIDIRSSRGRQQFWRCAREIAKDFQFQFECVVKVGYRAVPASENTRRMHNRMGRAKRRLRDAAFIGLHTALADLTAEQRAANADILARVGRLAQAITEQRREIRSVIVGVEPKRLPHPAREINQ
jgi:hypothetical protein